MLRKVIAFGGSVGVALLLAALGLIYSAKVLLFAALIILAVVVVAWLFLWAHPLAVPVLGPESERAAEEARERQERRRKIIDDARRMVAQHEINRDSWERTMQISPAFSAIRPHLSSAYWSDMGKRERTIVLGAVHQGNVAAFVRELDRLEREWGLS